MGSFICKLNVNAFDWYEQDAAQAGALHLQNGAYDAAVCSLTAAIELATASERVPEYLLMRAECHESLGQVKEVCLLACVKHTLTTSTAQCSYVQDVLKSTKIQLNNNHPYL